MESIFKIEDIVEITLTSPSLIHFRIDVVGFVNPPKVVVRNAFLVFSMHEMELNWKAKHKVKG
jgi:hypothetical protein